MGSEEKWEWQGGDKRKFKSKREKYKQPESDTNLTK